MFPIIKFGFVINCLWKFNDRASILIPKVNASLKVLSNVLLMGSTMRCNIEH